MAESADRLHAMIGVVPSFAVRFTSAPAAISSSAHSRCPVRHAACRHVYPLRSERLMAFSAPRSASSSLRASAWPACAAWYAGHRSFPSERVWSAPFSSSACTTWVCPLAAAISSALMPPDSTASTLDPHASNRRVRPTSPRAAAQWSARNFPGVVRAWICSGNSQRMMRMRTSRALEGAWQRWCRSIAPSL